MYFEIWDTYRTLNIVYQIDSNIMAKPKMSTASTNSIKHEYLRFVTCHFHHRLLTFPQIWTLSRYSCLYLGSCIREFFLKKCLKIHQVIIFKRNLPKKQSLAVTNVTSHLKLISSINVWDFNLIDYNCQYLLT